MGERWFSKAEGQGYMAAADAAGIFIERSARQKRRYQSKVVVGAVKRSLGKTEAAKARKLLKDATK